jgi:hypothetical protein
MILGKKAGLYLDLKIIKRITFGPNGFPQEDLD